MGNETRSVAEFQRSSEQLRVMGDLEIFALAADAALNALARSMQGDHDRAADLRMAFLDLSQELERRARKERELQTIRPDDVGDAGALLGGDEGTLNGK